MPRNVVLLVLDTVRADALEPYGAPGGASPALASLAASGQWIDDDLIDGRFHSNSEIRVSRDRRVRPCSSAR